MADNRTKEQRSYNMSRIGSKNTSLELLVRKKLHALGFRYTLSNKQLPGRPDIVMPRYKTAIFVNGCFWHRCTKCAPKTPKSNYEFWQKKFDANVRRDRENTIKLEGLGWSVINVWECELKEDADKIVQTITRKATENLTPTHKPGRAIPKSEPEI